MGSLPGKAETNPKAHCNVILPRSEDEDLVRQKLKDKEYLEESEKALEEIAKLLESSHDEKNVNKGEELVDESTKKKPYVPPPYEPKVPFPRRVYTKKEKSVLSQFKKDLRQLEITLPMNDRLDQVPTQVKFIKSILANKEKLEELMQITEAPKAPPLKTPPMSKTLIKKEHPGKFIIPCSIGGVKFNDALCDSGAFVNVISSDMVNKMGLKGMKPNSTPLVFGDASKKTPKGIIEDYPIMVGNCIVPTDLLVLDMVDSKKQPLILGAPFLTTVGAIIDYEKKVVVLKNVDAKVSYSIEPPTGLCGTITSGEAYIELKVSTMVEDTPLLAKDVVEVQDELEYGFSLVKVANVQEVEEKLKEEAKKVKVAKTTKKKKLEKAMCEPCGSNPPSLTFKPLEIIDGKLECKVTSKGHSKPFAKARIILDPRSKENDLGVIKKTMASAFGIKIDDRGPPFQDGSPSTNP